MSFVSRALAYICAKAAPAPPLSFAVAAQIVKPRSMGRTVKPSLRSAHRLRRDRRGAPLAREVIGTHWLQQPDGWSRVSPPSPHRAKAVRS